MKITRVLWAQHLGRMTKRHWWAHGKRIVHDVLPKDCFAGKDIEIVDAIEAMKPPKPVTERIVVPTLFPVPPPMDKTHPDWNERPCLKYGNESLLLDGTDQARVLLKTELFADKLPERLETLEEEESPEVDELIERLIHSSHIFDAHQEKLPKKKDPLKPEWVFPRIYGIPDVRKVHNLTQKLLQVCDLKCGVAIAQQRKLIHGGQVRAYIERGKDLLYLESTIDTMITSNKLLTPMSDNNEFSTPLPDIAPLDPTISLRPQQFYNLRDQYPVAAESPWMNVHTIFINFDGEKVKNLTERPVMEPQIIARSMMQSFGTAVCCAKKKFGEETMNLPEPVTVQCVQTNGRWFYFSVFQLNTLDINGHDGTRNIFWHSPKTELFERAEYVGGVPTVDNYNPEVFRKILAFYRNA